MAAAGPREVFLGGYDPVKRREEVWNRLQLSFEAIRKEDLHEAVCGSGSQPSKENGKDGDDVSIKLATIVNEVKILKTNVEKFPGPHFTKVYRTLQGDCTKFQSDLDRLDVSGREDIRKKRREMLLCIDSLAKELARKTHADGKSCDDCEIRE